MTGGSQLLILIDRNYPSDWQVEMFCFGDDIGLGGLAGEREKLIASRGLAVCGRKVTVLTWC